jgi:hypothetical protein
MSPCQVTRSSVLFLCVARATAGFTRSSSTVGGGDAEWIGPRETVSFSNCIVLCHVIGSAGRRTCLMTGGSRRKNDTTPHRTRKAASRRRNAPYAQPASAIGKAIAIAVRT